MSFGNLTLENINEIIQKVNENIPDSVTRELVKLSAEAKQQSERALLAAFHSQRATTPIPVLEFRLRAMRKSAFNLLKGAFSQYLGERSLIEEEEQNHLKRKYMDGLVKYFFAKKHKIGNCIEFAWGLLIECLANPDYQNLNFTVLQVTLAGEHNFANSHNIVLITEGKCIKTQEDLQNRPEIIIADAWRNNSQFASTLEGDRLRVLLPQWGYQALIDAYDHNPDSVHLEFTPIDRQDFVNAGILFKENLVSYENVEFRDSQLVAEEVQPEKTQAALQKEFDTWFHYLPPSTLDNEFFATTSEAEEKKHAEDAGQQGRFFNKPQQSNDQALKFFDQANVLFQKKKFTEALPLYKKAIDNYKNQDATLATMYYNTGSCHHHLQDFDAAIEYTKKALTLRKTKLKKNDPLIGNTQQKIQRLKKERDEANTQPKP